MLQSSASLAYIRRFEGIAGQFVYSTSVVVWSVIISVWFHELGDFVVPFKWKFYFSVPEEVCNFLDLWGYTSECRPLGVAFGSSGW